MSRFIITWNTALDDRVCPICRPLHGRRWEFDSTKDARPHQLVARQQTVWDCDVDEPRTHGTKPWNCRCRLSFTWDLSDVRTYIKTLTEQVEAVATHE